MPRKKQTKGSCTYCGRVLAKSGMVRHLASCPKLLETIASTEQDTSAEETLVHMQVRDPWGGDYWLNLEMRGSARLNELDGYLRNIWLECCGHMSRFSTSGWGSPDIPMTRQIEAVFGSGDTLIHQYDFGTTSETMLKFVSSRKGKPTTKQPIALMARNLLPETECIECGQPAAWLCLECVHEDDVAGWLCDMHGETHPHDDYGDPIPIVNSPRLGLCGYDGPADPPY